MKRDYTIAMLLKLKALGSMKTKLTATIVEALGATGIEYAIGDVEHKGLTLRVSGTGVKSFALAYRSPRSGKKSCTSRSGASRR